MKFNRSVSRMIEQLDPVAKVPIRGPTPQYRSGNFLEARFWITSVDWQSHVPHRAMRHYSTELFSPSEAIRAIGRCCKPNQLRPAQLE